MITETRLLLETIRGFLENNPVTRPALHKLHRKMTGRPIHPGSLSRHLAARVTPNLDTGLVYLRFAQVHGILVTPPGATHLLRFAYDVTQPRPGKKPGKKPCPSR